MGKTTKRGALVVSAVRFRARRATRERELSVRAACINDRCGNMRVRRLARPGGGAAPGAPDRPGAIAWAANLCA